MKTKLTTVVIGTLLCYSLIIACKPKDPEYPVNPSGTTTTLTPYAIKYPERFPEMIIPDDNKPFSERIELGRMLYYDPLLSNDGRSCSGCHLQSYGFTIPGTKNNIPVLPHVNMGWYNNFMWNGSKKGRLEDVMLFETKEFFATDLSKINASEKYKPLFKKCFGVDNITHKEIAYALAQFARTMISGETKYDRFISGEANLTADERKGWEIFFSEKGDCFHCHAAIITTDNLFHNTGLDSIYTTEADKGYYNVTKDASDLGKFRTPNLRNVALRTSYMHDGRFTSLEEVVDFYDSKVRKVATLDPIMTKPGKENGLKLTAMEKAQLVAFLKTLTDSVFINNSNLSKP